MFCDLAFGLSVLVHLCLDTHQNFSVLLGRNLGHQYWLIRLLLVTLSFSLQQPQEDSHQDPAQVPRQGPSVRALPAPGGAAIPGAGAAPQVPAGEGSVPGCGHSGLHPSQQAGAHHLRQAQASRAADDEQVVCARVPGTCSLCQSRFWRLGGLLLIRMCSKVCYKTTSSICDKV